MADSPLIDIGQHRIGTAESQQRRLGEEPAHLRQCAVPAKGRHQQAHGQKPKRCNCQQQGHQAAPAEAGVRGYRGIVVNQRRALAGPGCAVATTGRELCRQQPATDITQQCGRQHDQREGDLKRENGHERGRGNGP
ncbi:hypothetical protein D9M71_728200 [compost metagenome]